MATISKVPRANGVSYRAIVKRNGVVLTTKCFKTRTAARQWAKRVESDAEFIEASGEPGSRLTLEQVAQEYLEEWSGRSRGRQYQINWWVQQLGRQKLSSVSVDDVRTALDDYTHGRRLIRVGSDAAGRSIAYDLSLRLLGGGAPRSATLLGRLQRTVRYRACPSTAYTCQALGTDPAT